MMQTTAELCAYYAGLLIIQYVGKERAFQSIRVLAALAVLGQCENTIQTFSLDGQPASGHFKLNFNGVPTAFINWNASLADIQSAVQAVIGVNQIISISGSLSSQTFQIVFNNALDFPLMTVTNNTLEQSDTTPIAITNAGNPDLGPLPLQVQNAFTFGQAVGTQLDTLGKYAGVSRNGFGFTGPISLDDADFTKLIQLATIQNNSGSSLATIQNLLNTFFPGEILVFDYQTMRMSYLISSSVGTQPLVQLFVTEGLLPKPMGVELASVIYAPVITTFFGFRTYDAPQNHSSPFNNYDTYNMAFPWLSYADAVTG